MKRILVADHDYNVTFTLEKLLRAESYDVLSCHDTNVLWQLAGSHNFDLIIVNTLMKTVDGSDIIPLLQMRQAGAAFIVIYEEHSTERKIIPRVFDQIQKPIDFPSTINRIRELFTGGGFSGIITGINLADYIQIFCMNKITKAILVKKNQQQGIILIQDGRVVYADTVGLKGEEAFYEILSWQQGQIKEVKIKKFPTPNIDKDVQQLLLSATLFTDESTAGHNTANETPGTEMVAALCDESHTASQYADVNTQRKAEYRHIPRKGFNRKRIGMGVAIMILLLIGLTFSFQNIFRDEVRAGKTPTSPSLESNKQLSRPITIIENPALNSSGQENIQGEKKTGGTENPAHSGHTITLSQQVLGERDAIPEEIIFRLHGSNTIGAKLASALVTAYLKGRLNAVEITNSPGLKDEEQIVRGKINGKKVAVEIQAHGSTTGFEDLAANSCDIGMASRKIKDKEIERLTSLGDMTSISSEHIIGLDGIAVIINKNNALEKISTENLQAIFAGKMADWQSINSQNGTIGIYARDDKSGTYDTFKSLILGEKNPLVSSAKRYESNQELSDDVSKDPLGIGFTGLPYVRNSKPLAVSEEGAQSIYPNFFTVASEDYPISRRLYMYTASLPKNPHVTPFIQFTLSEEGQKVVQEIGFVDMNIRSFYMDPAGHDNNASMQTVRDYLKAIKDAQRLSLNFRFKKNETALDNRSVRDLDRIVAFLADKLDKRILLAGFADNSGDSNANYKLAMARARFVASELKARGIAVSDTLSCGQEMPVASNMTEQGKEKNRRVEVWLK